MSQAEGGVSDTATDTHGHRVPARLSPRVTTETFPGAGVVGTQHTVQDLDVRIFLCDDNSAKRVRPCSGCNNPTTNTGYCADCFRAWKELPAPEPRPCMVCGAEIGPERRRHARACSRACSSKAQKRRGVAL